MSKNTKVSHTKVLNTQVANTKGVDENTKGVDKNTKGADYRAILEEFIRNRNPREFSNAAILGTQERAPRNRFDIGGPLGNIADVFANFSQGRIQDQNETNKLNSLQKLPDEFLSLVAPYAIGGKDLGNLALGKYKTDQDTLLAQQKLLQDAAMNSNQNVFNKTTTTEAAKKYQDIASATDKSGKHLEEILDLKSPINRHIDNYSNSLNRSLQKGQGNVNDLAKYIDAIGRPPGTFIAGLGPAAISFNSGKISGLTEAYQNAGFKDPNLLHAVRELETDLNDQLQKYIADNNLSVKQLDSPVEVDRIKSVLGSFANNNIRERLISTFNDSYQRNYNQLKTYAQYGIQIPEQINIPNLNNIALSDQLKSLSREAKIKLLKQSRNNK